MEEIYIEITFNPQSFPESMNDLVAEVKETMEQLLKDGIVQISGYNDEGEPLFVLTELGNQVKKELGNQ